MTETPADDRATIACACVADLGQAPLPSVTVVVRSKDEGPRLRLTLASLAVQSHRCEVVVIDDGSSDQTPDILGEMAQWPGLVGRLVHYRNETSLGRSRASNLGAAIAQGEILLFLDGDTLADPDCVRRHAVAQRDRGGCMIRGETWHLRQTRPFVDPELGIPFAHDAEQVARMSDRDLQRSLITRQQITEDFDRISSRAQPGIYPGSGPRRLYEMEISTLQNAPDCPTVWAAASGANQSLPRASFMAQGGFDEDMQINAHREHALRQYQAGLAFSFAAGAKTYHMTHRSGWRDPLHMADWEDHFFARHRSCEVPLLSVMWAGYSDSVAESPADIADLQALHRAARRCTEAGGDQLATPAHVRNLHVTLAGAAVVHDGGDRNLQPT